MIGFIFKGKDMKDKTGLQITTTTFKFGYEHLPNNDSKDGDKNVIDTKQESEDTQINEDESNETINPVE